MSKHTPTAEQQQAIQAAYAAGCETSIDMYNMLREQHDELVAALKDLATADNEGICRTGHHASWIALAALEKVQQS